VNKEL